ncbi:U-box domain-containing protein 9 [Artemisia annua]|uniref:U-box domain-containing protein 9 n=1 Tax=Artemisia annua TaxID=35608 RepID=A0A2U1N9E0_ARTAN|nr:U-box domain-containing protein 9 [Artemisia annua]
MSFYTSMEDLIGLHKPLAMRRKIDANLEEDLIATMFYISKHHPTILKSTQMVISAITDAFKSVRIATITHAVSALYLLSKHEENATIIFKSIDAIKPLLDLLADSYYHNQFLKESVTETICNLFLVHDNLKEAVSNYLITICSKLMVTLVEDREGLLSTINVFSQSIEVVEKLVELDLLSVLFLYVKDKTDSPLIKEKYVYCIQHVIQ